MISPTVFAGAGSLAGPAFGTGKGEAPAADERSEVGKRFEQMLWADMLSHAGLEKSFTLGGGEAASAFSRYIVEAIAGDLAETHPLGLAEKVDALNTATAEGSRLNESQNR